MIRCQRRLAWFIGLGATTAKIAALPHPSLQRQVEIRSRDQLHRDGSTGIMVGKWLQERQGRMLEQGTEMRACLKGGV